MPPVELIDMRHQPVKRGRPGALSDALERAMRDALKAGGQVILLLNRRGFSTHVHCPTCGHVEQCRFCDLALTYHKERDLCLCHHCGYEQPPAQNCPQCGQGAVRYQGIGTEKLQVEIEQRFPNYVIRRMDSDTMKRQGSHARVLAAFRNGLIHVLLGTQMIAKGLDFPNVTLVGVVNADIGLHVPDFRAGERTFQLLAQVSGRAGRGATGGKVLVQTFTPEHPAVALAATHDYIRFVGAELAQRQAHGYPPFQRMARIVVRGRDQEATASFAETMAHAFQATLGQLEAKESHGGQAFQPDSEAGKPDLPAPEREALGVRLLGPAEAPVFRLKGYHRFHFQLQSPSPGTLHRLLRAVLPTLRPPNGIEFMLDIDPFQMM